MNDSLYDRIGGRDNIASLIRHFYADARQHGVIGPVFETAITNWPEHLEKITDFWSTVTGGPARYSGNMPANHLPLGLKEEHFEAWLTLWRFNCRAHLSPTTARELIALAETIARRLRSITGLPMDKPFPGLDFLAVRTSQ